MRAAIYERTGPARDVLSIVELPDPTPGAGEVRVKLQWSGVNPSDVKSRAGVRSKTLPFPRIIPHSDGSGVIDAIGADVPRSRIGERVWTWNAAWGRPFGTAAEYAVLPSQQVVPLPEGIDLAAAACFGIPALTAYYAVHVDGGVAGKNVLVAGGAGAVGHYAIQMAKLAGAKQVLTTVSGPEKAAVARAAGADLTLNYKTDDLATKAQQATGGRGVDRIIEVDFGSNVQIDQQLVKADGEIVVYGSNAPEIAVPFVPMIVKNVGIRFFIVYNLSPEARAAAIAGLTAMLQNSALTHNIAARLPLDEIAAAHELVEHGRVIGNVVVQIP
jgi:NADPH2:quinone reductase